MNERTASRGRVLVVEDEAYVRESLVEILRARRFDTSAAASVADALVHLERAPVDVVLSDLRMPGADGLELVRRMQTAAPDVPVVILTGHGNVASAVECLKAGASDYILKPAEPDALEVALDRALEGRALRREVRYLRSAVAAQSDVAVGESAPWRRVTRMVEAAAAADSVVLFTGESGTGKELLARRLHALSRRAAGPFVKVNCAACPSRCGRASSSATARAPSPAPPPTGRAASSSPTGGPCSSTRSGPCRSAGQAKLLRAIQDGEFERLGDEQPTRVDVRVVASTNGDLEAEVQQGRFRADLFYSLNVVRIDVPPLRERRDDIPLLARHFADQIAQRLGRPSPELPPSALARLARLPVARQRPRAAQRHRAGADPRPGAGARGPRPRPGPRRAPLGGGRAPRGAGAQPARRAQQARARAAARGAPPGRRRPQGGGAPPRDRPAQPELLHAQARPRRRRRRGVASPWPGGAWESGRSGSCRSWSRRSRCSWRSP